jgi:hypothetical protein
MISNETADFFATRLEIENMQNGCVRAWFFGDRKPPGQPPESALLVTMVMPAAVFAKAIGKVALLAPVMQ